MWLYAMLAQSFPFKKTDLRLSVKIEGLVNKSCLKVSVYLIYYHFDQSFNHSKNVALGLLPSFLLVISPE